MDKQDLVKDLGAIGAAAGPIGAVVGLAGSVMSFADAKKQRDNQVASTT